jgi:nitrate reductase (NAD(P)H)
MSPADDVILAYEYNGWRLAPDHGFPVCLLIPGFIGGRCFKWVQEITVLDDSDNYYHLYDYRTLPTDVDMEQADDERNQHPAQKDHTNVRLE